MILGRTTVAEYAWACLVVLIVPVAIAAPNLTVALLALLAVPALPLLRHPGTLLVAANMPVFAGLAGLTIWGLGACVWAPDPAAGLDLWARLTAMTVLGFGAAAAVAVTTDERRALLAKAFGATVIAGVVILLAATAVYLLTGFPEGGSGRDPLDRLNRGITVLAVASWAGLPALTRHWGKKIAIAALLGTGAAVFLLNSLSAMLGYLVAAIVWALAIGTGTRWMGRVLATLAVVGVLTAPVVIGALPGPDALANRFPGLPPSAVHRLYIWDFAEQRISEKPILGWGMDASRRMPGGKEVPPVGAEMMPLHPHNGPLQLWMELGGIGAVIGAFLIAALLLSPGRQRLRSRWESASGLAGMAGYLAIGLTAFGLWQNRWVAVAWLLLVGFTALTDQPGDDQQTPRKAEIT